MDENLKPLTCSYEADGTTRATFDSKEFRKFLNDNPDARAVIRDDAGNVIGILHTGVIREEMLSEQSFV